LTPSVLADIEVSRQERNTSKVGLCQVFKSVSLTIVLLQQRFDLD